ncbi:MAG: tetratricopeptide repeat protein [Rickettsiales bacterium]|nr:tetratricopeptide repeat protein [Rickettsiales bacterium]
MATQAARMTANDPMERQYLQAEQLLNSGQLKDAAALCEQMLNANPMYHRGYFLLSRLFSSVGNTDKSLEYIDKAITYAPQEEALYFYLRGNGNLLKDHLEEAEADFLKALSIDRKMALATLLLGTTYIKMNRLDEAEKKLLSARSMGLRNEATEQLGILYQSQGELKKALDAFDALIAMMPDYASAYQQRAGTHAIMKSWDMVVADARKAIQLNAEPSVPYYMLGLGLYHEKKYADAAVACEQAVNLDQNHRKSWDLLALALQRAGQLDHAVTCLKMIIERYPDDVNVYRSLAPLLMGMERKEEAVEYLDKGLTLFPDDGILSHFKASFDTVSIDTASENYVRDLFDGYAEEFDYQLQNVLDYRTPQLLADALRAVLKRNPYKNPLLRMLDIGCGTGLGGVAMQDITSYRVGIDISSNMVQKTRERGIYGRVEESEITKFYAQEQETYDVVYAADVYVYIGNIESNFAGAHKVLVDGGYYVFSVERDDAAPQGFILRASGRFAHARSYIERLAVQYGFTIESITEAGIRKERGTFLDGYLVVLKKS